jgi:two-component system, NtrC family, sensor kinase
VKLVPKLGLSLFAGVFAVVAVFAALKVKSDIAQFDQDARNDQRVVGITGGAALSTTRTREEALLMTRRVDASRATMRIRYVAMDGGGAADERSLLSLEASQMPAPGKWLQLVKPGVPGVDASDILVTYVAAPVADAPLGAMELSQPLASKGAYAWRGFMSALLSSLAMLLVGGVAMAAIGVRLVGQPVAELIGAARRIGEGHFNVVESSKRQDEFGEIARALSAMSSDLAAERRRATAEAEARIVALDQLRHAERLSTLGQLASVLAHEVGTPLNVIAGHAKLIAMGRLDAPAVKESASGIGAQCERITSIVRRVLDYARRSPPRRRRVQAADIVGQTWAMLRGLAQQRDVELAWVAPSEPIEVLADPDQIQQALTNIVINALHASPARTQVMLTVEAAERVVDAETKSFAVLVVRDEGQGIAEHLLEKIFEPFFTTKALGEGTGLGLSVARDIVAEHGGSVQVVSTPSKGTTFKIYLPSAALEPPET